MLAAGIISEVLQTRKQGYRYLRPFQNYGLGQFHITLYNLYQVAYLTEKNISYDPRIESTTAKHVFSGTLDEVFERLEKENNRLRYCNGHYFEFDDNEHRCLYRMWTRLIPYWRSFNLYYGNGIVD